MDLGNNFKMANDLLQRIEKNEDMNSPLNKQRIADLAFELRRTTGHLELWIKLFQKLEAKDDAK